MLSAFHGIHAQALVYIMGSYLQERGLYFFCIICNSITWTKAYLKYCWQNVPVYMHIHNSLLQQKARIHSHVPSVPRRDVMQCMLCKTIIENLNVTMVEGLNPTCSAPKSHLEKSLFPFPFTTYWCHYCHQEREATLPCCLWPWSRVGGSKVKWQWTLGGGRVNGSVGVSKDSQLAYPARRSWWGVVGAGESLVGGSVGEWLN